MQVPPEDLQHDILTNGAGCREEMEEELPGSQDTETESKPSFGTPPDFGVRNVRKDLINSKKH